MLCSPAALCSWTPTYTATLRSRDILCCSARRPTQLTQIRPPYRALEPDAAAAAERGEGDPEPGHGRGGHADAQPHRAPAPRPRRRGHPHHRRPRHALRLQHRPQPMGEYAFAASNLSDSIDLADAGVYRLIALRAEPERRGGVAVRRQEVSRAGSPLR
jgi:hypothetical protein